MRIAKLATYLVFCVGIAAACWFRPAPDDFDRYVYEALIRSSKQPIEEIYRVVKHESTRAEASSVLDSPEHLAQLEPLYAIRPLYVQVITLASRFVRRPQSAINFVSAVSFMGCAVAVGVVTRRYLYSALLIASPGIFAIGRLGTPDALSSFAMVVGCIAILKDKLLAGILLLMISIWIRTDNVLFVLAVLAWLAWKNHLKGSYAAILGVVAIASVFWINELSGNYGWAILFHYSFIGGKYPAEIVPHVTIWTYIRVAIGNAASLAPQLAPWLLLAVAGWTQNRRDRSFLTVIFVASLLHYLFFPSGESRYFAWAFLLIGIVFIRALKRSTTAVADYEAPALSLTPSETAKMTAA